MVPIVIPQGRGYIPDSWTYDITHFRKLKEEVGDSKHTTWMLYLHYYYYPDFTKNPYANLEEFRKDGIIKKSLGIHDIEEPKALKECKEYVRSIYETPITRLHVSLKNAIDKMAQYLDSVKITDKNIRNVNSVINSFNETLRNYDETTKRIQEMLSNNQKVKGGTKIAYDQK